MNRFLLLGVLLVLVAVQPARAQLTIDRAAIENRVDVLVESFEWDANDNVAGSPLPDTTGLQAILNGGEADFTTMVENLLLNATFEWHEMPADVPGADSFATATHVQVVHIPSVGEGEDSTFYQFLYLDDDNLVFQGTATNLVDITGDTQPDTLVARYMPDGWQVRDLPVTSGDFWETSFSQVSWVPVPGFGIIRSEGTRERRTYDVLGSTTLHTPAGSEPALMVRILERIDVIATVIHLERFTFLTESGLEVTVAFEVDDAESDAPQRLRLNDVAYFVPEEGSGGGGGGGGGGTGTAIEAVDTAVPAGFTLEQNYPNPFNPTTVIPFALKRAGHVTLTVYDALGREVAVLVNEHLPAGSYTTGFQAQTLPSGVYLYQLQAAAAVVNRRMIVQK